MATKKKLPRKKAQTRFQRLMRGPLFWIVAAIVAVTVFGQISTAGNKYTQVNTSQVLAAISQNQVDSALLIDKVQKIQLKLKSGVLIGGASKI